MEKVEVNMVQMVPTLPKLHITRNGKMSNLQLSESNGIPNVKRNIWIKIHQVQKERADLSDSTDYQIVTDKSKEGQQHSSNNTTTE